MEMRTRMRRLAIVNHAAGGIDDGPSCGSAQ